MFKTELVEFIIVRGVPILQRLATRDLTIKEQDRFYHWLKELYIAKVENDQMTYVGTRAAILATVPMMGERRIDRIMEIMDGLKERHNQWPWNISKTVLQKDIELFKALKKS